MTKFNHRLKELRNARNLTQQKLADMVGMSKSSINMYERGEREPGLDILEALSDVFNVDLDYMLGKSDIPRKSLNVSVKKENIQITSLLNRHLSKYNQLNTLGQKKTDEYIDDLLENPKYTKTDEASKPSKALNMIPKVDLQGKIYRAARSVDDTPPQTIDYDETLKKDLKNAKKVTKLEDL